MHIANFRVPYAIGKRERATRTCCIVHIAFRIEKPRFRSCLKVEQTRFSGSMFIHTFSKPPDGVGAPTERCHTWRQLERHISHLRMITCKVKPAKCKVQCVNGNIQFARDHMEHAPFPISRLLLVSTERPLCSCLIFEQTAFSGSMLILIVCNPDS